jgi:CheY-like chemotaxis protein
MTARPRQVPLILNVDDDDGGRYAVSRDLIRGGYDVLDACTGTESLELAVRRQPDLILLDVHLPDIDGFEVCRRLKADPRTAGIPVLHISASYLDDHSRVKGLNTGANGYLTEPVEPAVLNATVKSLLRIKQAEQETALVAGQWQTTFDAISDGVAIVDLQGTIARSNRAFQALAAAVNLPTESMIEPAFLEGMLRTRRRETAERIVNERVLRITLDPIFDASGVITSSVLIVSDITARRRIEDQMRHAQKLESIGLLAGGVAHDFNNLLTGILGNASLALDAKPSGEIAGYLQDVIKASERAADLARQLLAYAGKGQFHVHLVDLPAVIRDILPLIQAGIPRKVDVVLEFDSPLPHVEADVSQLRQLIMNLVINGAEAIGDSPGRVCVSATSRYLPADTIRQRFFAADEVEDGEFVLLRVEDSGCGMDPSTQSRVFDPFFTTKFFGRGLGLAAALGIVRQHRGGIRLESIPGAGTTFEVVLPASERKSTKQPLLSQTVLVVDDEEIVRSIAKAALEKFGYGIVLAEDGREGVEIFTREPDRFSAVLLDLSMPVMGGEEALQRMLEANPDAKVILISGYDESDVMRRVGRTRAVGFLQKPFTASRLAQAVREAANHRAQRAENEA